MYRSFKNYSNNIDGWMSENELIWLAETATLMENVIEIGVWKGRSAHAILTGCDGTVYLVDHFKGNSNENNNDQEPHWEATYKNIATDLLDNLKEFNFVLMKMNSFEASKLFKPKSIDMVFLDAGHLILDIKRDLDFWTPICRKLICGHDYWQDDVKIVVDKKFGFENVINPADTIWAVNL